MDKIHVYTVNNKKIIMVTLVILGMFGGQEMLFVLIAILILFGGRKIPELMRGIGKGVSEFNKAKDGIYDDRKKEEKEEEKKDLSK